MLFVQVWTFAFSFFQNRSESVPKIPPNRPKIIPKPSQIRPKIFVFFSNFFDFFLTLGANPGVPWRPKADPFFGDFWACNSTFEPITGLRHYSSWIRLVFLMQICVVDSFFRLLEVRFVIVFLVDLGPEPEP